MTTTKEDKPMSTMSFMWLLFVSLLKHGNRSIATTSYQKLVPLNRGCEFFVDVKDNKDNAVFLVVGGT